jgi:hypothetical protein
MRTRLKNPTTASFSAPAGKQSSFLQQPDKVLGLHPAHVWRFHGDLRSPCGFTIDDTLAQFSPRDSNTWPTDQT